MYWHRRADHGSSAVSSLLLFSSFLRFIASASVSQTFLAGSCLPKTVSEAAGWHRGEWQPPETQNPRDGASLYHDKEANTHALRA